MTRAAARRARAEAPWAVVTALVATVLMGLLAGCGASPKALGPAGIDGLTIPTPTPDPADFSDGAVNAWFPLEAGTRWVYRQYLPDGERTVVATVLPHSRTIAGVATTAVRWQVGRRAGNSAAMVRWYAVDRAGNVWWFGQRVVPQAARALDRLAPHSWQAGRDGAEAGVILTATPREGDGYANGRRPHVVERRSTVISLDGTVATTRRTFRHTVVTRDLSSLAPLHDVQTYYSRGLGMVAQQDTTSISTSLSLIRMSHG